MLRCYGVHGVDSRFHSLKARGKLIDSPPAFFERHNRILGANASAFAAVVYGR